MLTIDLDYFVKRLTCWLAPEILIQAARRLESDRGQALQRSGIVLTSVNLSTARDGGLMFLVEAFIERFKIPTEVIEWLKQPEFDLPADVLDEISKYKFSGNISRPTPEMQISPGVHPIVLVEESDIYADILTQPMMGLAGMVSLYAKTWMYFLDHNMQTSSFFLKHVSADPFGAWMDATTAQQLGFPDIADPKNPASMKGGLNNGYRLVTIAGWEEEQKDLVMVCRSAAKLQADQTIEPLDNKGVV